MKLHNILYLAGFCCLMIGAGGVDGWLENGTSILIPIVLMLISIPLFYLGYREDGKVRKGDSRYVSFIRRSRTDTWN